MNTLHIVGRKNHGKTTLLVALLAELTGRGLRVGSIKHTSHLYDL
jgi:molybdopterin-guanine dinucleotide biosynthesis protein B